jgi:NAD(P)-dependent dehydrogenase (short-subunit alcohol dehydrogenase family)
MDIKDKIVAVTGGGGGIGRALAEVFSRAGARHVVVADLDGAAAESVARAIGGSSFTCDVSREADITRIVSETEKSIGPIDLFCSNAGILPINPDPENAASSPNGDWQRAWEVNVMAHVYAARALLPAMIARRSGYFLNTVSAAGLLSQIGSAAYATTKHAAIGFAENLALTHKDHGIKVSVLCPQAVGTKMIEGKPMNGADVDGILSAEQVAGITIAGIMSESFLILPHPNVAKYYAAKSENYDRWLGGMAKLRRSAARGVV